MTTDWHNPHNVSQYAENAAELIHVQWDDSTGFAGIKTANGASIGTLDNLIHIARSPKPNITNKTYFLKMTNYQFQNVPSVISGIELKLYSKRQGRVTDDLVSLTYNDELIGGNQARLDINTVMYYGSNSSLWGATYINLSKVLDQSFGVVLRFKSHPSYPHKDPIDLISVQLRIH